jgi:hypothetical protein
MNIVTGRWMAMRGMLISALEDERYREIGRGAPVRWPRRPPNPATAAFARGRGRRPPRRQARRCAVRELTPTRHPRHRWRPPAPLQPAPPAPRFPASASTATTREHNRISVAETRRARRDDAVAGGGRRRGSRCVRCPRYRSSPDETSPRC